MASLGEIRIEATLENVRVILAYIDGIAQRLQLTEKTQFEIELAVEEASINIVNHAYPEDEKGDIRVQVDEMGDSLIVTLTDWGEPLHEESVKPFDIDAPIETRIQGGMGLHFIHSLADDVERTVAPEEGGPNLLRMTKHIERLKPGAQQHSVLRELNAMLNVSRIMTSNMKLDDLLERIINELVTTIGAERGTLYLIDEDRNELFSRVFMKDSDELQEIRVKIGEGIAGMVAATGKTLNIEDAYSDPHFMPSFDHVTSFQTRTILAAPMRNHYQKIIGVVQLLNKRDGEFTTRDERLLTAMAAQAAVSIENARLYAQEMRQQLLNQELETAKAIQKSFLPQRMPEHKHWDFATFWLPMREVGGDFYDFYELPDGRWAIVIADVSGKGVPAAMFMALCVTMLRFAMGLNFQPDRLLDRTNQGIITDQTSKMFATAFTMFLDLETGETDFASAGHNPPILYRAATGDCEYLEASGVAMGLFTSAAFEQGSSALQPGDVLVLYTDGITEIIDSEENEFGEDQLEALIAENSHRTAQELVDLIIDAVVEFSVDQGGFDDETLIIIKKTA